MNKKEGGEMYLMSFIFVLIIAGGISLFFTYGFRNRGPWDNFWSFFLILFLALWAVSLWIEPIGPALYGVAWLPLVVAGLIIALLLAATTPPLTSRKPPKSATDMEKEAAEEVIAVSFGAFFWFLLVSMIIAIALGYII